MKKTRGFHSVLPGELQNKLYFIKLQFYYGLSAIHVITQKYLHFIVDTKIHEVAIANGVYGGDHYVLDFGVFVSQVDPFDGIIPVNPATLSFNLSKAPQCK